MSLKPETVMEKYVELRDQRATLAKKFKDKDAELVANMERMEAWLLSKMQAAGTDSFKNDAGTAYIQIKIKASCADWTNGWAWMLENKRVDMLEKRLSSAAVKEYKEEHGEYPPFVNVIEEREVVVRRA